MLRVGAMVAHLAHNQNVEGPIPSPARLGRSLVVKHMSYKHRSGGSIPPGPIYSDNAKLPKWFNGGGCNPPELRLFGGSNPSLRIVYANVAQVVEHTAEDRGVGGANPSVGTFIWPHRLTLRTSPLKAKK